MNAVHDGCRLLISDDTGLGGALAEFPGDEVMPAYLLDVGGPDIVGCERGLSDHQVSLHTVALPGRGDRLRDPEIWNPQKLVG